MGIWRMNERNAGRLLFFYFLNAVNLFFFLFSILYLLYKLQQTNTNRLHLASYSVGSNQRKSFSRHKNNNNINENRKNPRSQIETIELKKCKNGK